jgi:hypothetical protein
VDRFTENFIVCALCMLIVRGAGDGWLDGLLVVCIAFAITLFQERRERRKNLSK